MDKLFSEKSTNLLHTLCRTSYRKVCSILCKTVCSILCRTVCSILCRTVCSILSRTVCSILCRTVCSKRYHFCAEHMQKGLHSFCTVVCRKCSAYSTELCRMFFTWELRRSHSFGCGWAHSTQNTNTHFYSNTMPRNTLKYAYAE